VRSGLSALHQSGRILLAGIACAASLGLWPDSGHAQADNCEENPLTHQFDSGASWELCWRIDELNALEVTRVHYTAPGEPGRQVLDSIGLATALIQYDNNTQPDNLLVPTTTDNTSLLPMSAENCSGTPLTDQQSQQPAVCQVARDLGNLTRYTTQPVIRRQAVSLISSLNTGSHTLGVRYTFTEDGRIDPDVSFSGRLNRFVNDPDFGSPILVDGKLGANASLYFLWRIDFNLNETPNNDVITEFQFEPDTQGRKLAQTTQLEVETLRKISPETFRGWQISDLDQSAVEGGMTRIGYYLDPQQSGLEFRNRELNWTQFNFAVTVKKDCERWSLDNSVLSPDCGVDLDDFVSGELLAGADPVIWYSITNRLIPNSADWPAIRSRLTGFSLLPFDWSASSPFSDLSAGEQ